MTQLRQDYQLFTERDTIIAAIGPENARSFKKHWEKYELPFIGLPDPEHKVLKLYGQEVKLIQLGRMPAQMIIDKKGILRYVHYGHSMQDIPKNEEILSLLDKLQHKYM